MRSASSSSSTIAGEEGHQEVDNGGHSPLQRSVSHWQLVYDQTHITPEVLNWKYKGAGTEDDPYVVEYIDNDRRNPMLFPQWKKWMITILVAIVSPLYLEVLRERSSNTLLRSSQDLKSSMNEVQISNSTYRQLSQSLLYLLPTREV